MSSVATIAAVGTAASAYSSNQAANAQQDAAHSAAMSQVGGAQLGRQGMQQLSDLMGYGLTAKERQQYGSTLRTEQGTNGLAQIKGAKNRLAWIADQTNKYADSRKSDPNFGFLSKRFDNSTFQQDPGYQFRLDQGTQGINNSLAARHNLFSGAAAKELDKYNQGFASNEYGNAYNRFTNDQNNMYNRAAGIMGTGQVAQNNMNEYNMQGANAYASGRIGMGNALTNGISQGVNNYQSQQLLDKFKPVK